MRLASWALRAVVRTLMETLPGDDREAGVFLSGMVWAFAVFWMLVFLVSLAVLGKTP